MFNSNILSFICKIYKFKNKIRPKNQSNYSIFNQMSHFSVTPRNKLMFDPYIEISLLNKI